MTIELGAYCKDVITGIEGHAVMRMTHITGCDRYSLQPRIQGDPEGKSVPECFDFDETRLIVDPEKSMGGFEDFDGDEPDIKLGMYVLDNITGFKGYVIIKVVDIAGRIRFGIQSTAPLKEGQKDGPPYYYTDWRRLEEAGDEKHPHLVLPGTTAEVETTNTSSEQEKSKVNKGADTLMGKCPM